MALARALIFGCALAGAWRISASAARAWPASGMGKLLFGPAKTELLSPRRADAVNRAMTDLLT